jgi:hypothetical protein
MNIQGHVEGVHEASCISATIPTKDQTCRGMRMGRVQLTCLCLSITKISSLHQQLNNDSLHTGAYGRGGAHLSLPWHHQNHLCLYHRPLEWSDIQGHVVGVGAVGAVPRLCLPRQMHLCLCIRCISALAASEPALSLHQSHLCLYQQLNKYSLVSFILPESIRGMHVPYGGPGAGAGGEEMQGE